MQNRQNDDSTDKMMIFAKIAISVPVVLLAWLVLSTTDDPIGMTLSENERLKTPEIVQLSGSKNISETDIEMAENQVLVIQNVLDKRRQLLNEVDKKQMNTSDGEKVTEARYELLADISRDEKKLQEAKQILQDAKTSKAEGR